MVINKREKKGGEWSGIEYITPSFEYLTSLIKEKKEIRINPSLTPQFGGSKNENFK